MGKMLHPCFGKEQDQVNDSDFIKHECTLD